ncbi:sodium channel protein type 9 subunit alpha [Striga asiatica]|uniref:Sodium channel protein type 9 subunit alpha n=1 Tax=Striga asiatica TaxID=4170 RepID=A0A5A7PQZ5_STRAF|nr:sodium channel protein type 9 subunit alpha [Striga asiatica]
MLYLPTMASISHSDEEIISDDEKIDHPTIGNARGIVDCTWSEASREVEALVCLNDNSSRHPSHGAFVKERKSSKGGEGRNTAKPKFVFLHDSRKEDVSMVISDRHGISSENSPTPDEINAAADEDTDELMSDCHPIYHDKESQDSENRCVPYEQAQKNDFKGLSMAEFLYSFDKSSNKLQGRIEHDIEKEQRRMQMIVKRNTSEQGDTNQAEDDPLESLDSGSLICSDDELVVPRTMTDQFHEAFGMVSAIDEGPQVTFPRPFGMHGKLQQVMQHEKQVYLKNLSGETDFNDEKMCISVRILTRSLEAKLIVCSCALVEDTKSSYWESNVELKVKGKQKTLTIIFNPRVCKDVELEVGNLISIRPPWTEVPVKEKDEVIYLCLYFTQINP